MHMIRWFAVSACLWGSALLVISCSLGPDYKRPRFLCIFDWNQEQGDDHAKLPDVWWRLYEDRELTRLLEQTLRGNPSLAESKARVDRARALVGIDRARMFPLLELTGSAASRKLVQDQIGAHVDGLTVPLERDRYRGSFDLNYEVELWGMKQSQPEASEVEAEAVVQLFAARRLGLATEWVRLNALHRGLSRQAVLLAKIVSSFKQRHDLLEDQHKAGLIEALPVRNAKSDWQLASNDLASVEHQLAATGQALALLCGKAPAGFRLAAVKAPAKLPTIRPGLTAEVLARRPDVRAAEQKLRAANARIGVSEATLYPSFSWFSAAGLEAISPAVFLDWQNRVSALDEGMAAPVFGGGSDREAWESAVNQRDEALAEFKQVLLTATKEVEDALLDLKSLAIARDALAKTVADLRQLRDAARERHAKGLLNELELGEAERAVMRLELWLVECEANQRISFAVLAKALGGGWNP